MFVSEVSSATKTIVRSHQTWDVTQDNTLLYTDHVFHVGRARQSTQCVVFVNNFRLLRLRQRHGPTTAMVRRHLPRVVQRRYSVRLDKLWRLQPVE